MFSLFLCVFGAAQAELPCIKEKICQQIGHLSLLHTLIYTNVANMVNEPERFMSPPKYEDLNGMFHNRTQLAILSATRLANYITQKPVEMQKEENIAQEENKQENNKKDKKENKSRTTSYNHSEWILTGIRKTPGGAIEVESEKHSLEELRRSTLFPYDISLPPRLNFEIFILFDYHILFYWTILHCFSEAIPKPTINLPYEPKYTYEEMEKKFTQQRGLFYEIVLTMENILQKLKLSTLFPTDLVQRMYQDFGFLSLYMYDGNIHPTVSLHNADILRPKNSQKPIEKVLAQAQLGEVYKANYDAWVLYLSMLKHAKLIDKYITENTSPEITVTPPDSFVEINIVEVESTSKSEIQASNLSALADLLSVCEKAQLKPDSHNPQNQKDSIATPTSDLTVLLKENSAKPSKVSRQQRKKGEKQKEHKKNERKRLEAREEKQNKRDKEQKKEAQKELEKQNRIKKEEARQAALEERRKQQKLSKAQIPPPVQQPFSEIKEKTIAAPQPIPQPEQIPDRTNIWKENQKAEAEKRRELKRQKKEQNQKDLKAQEAEKLRKQTEKKLRQENYRKLKEAADERKKLKVLADEETKRLADEREAQRLQEEQAQEVERLRLEKLHVRYNFAPSEIRETLQTLHQEYDVLNKKFDPKLEQTADFTAFVNTRSIAIRDWLDRVVQAIIPHSTFVAMGSLGRGYHNHLSDIEGMLLVKELTEETLKQAQQLRDFLILCGMKLDDAGLFPGTEGRSLFAVGTFPMLASLVHSVPEDNQEARNNFKVEFLKEVPHGPIRPSYEALLNQDNGAKHNRFEEHWYLIANFARIFLRSEMRVIGNDPYGLYEKFKVQLKTNLNSFVKQDSEPHALRHYVKENIKLQTGKLLDRYLENKDSNIEISVKVKQAWRTAYLIPEAVKLYGADVSWETKDWYTKLINILNGVRIGSLDYKEYQSKIERRIARLIEKYQVVVLPEDGCNKMEVQIPYPYVIMCKTGIGWAPGYTRSLHIPGYPHLGWHHDGHPVAFSQPLQLVA